MKLFILEKYRYLFSLICGLFILYFLFSVFIDAYDSSINFNGFFANGSFQLYNPLRRLSEGQIAGHDFQYFHGLGTVFLHYPVYKLFGGNLFGSEMAKHLVSGFLFVISTLIIMYALTRRLEYTLLLTLAAIFGAKHYYLSVYDPGNSLLGVRSTIPILVAAVVILFRTNKYRQIIISAMLGLSFFVSTEHGMAAIVGYLLMYIIFKDSNLRQRIRECLTILGGSIAAIFIFHLVVSGKYVFEAIKYALIDVPSDQFWYFGAPPSQFIGSIQEFIHYQKPIIYIYLIAILLICILFFIRKFFNETYALIFLLIYGLISNISIFGILSRAYSEPLVRIEVIVVLWLILRLALFLNPFISAKLKNYDYMMNFTSIVALLFLVGNYSQHIPHVLNQMENLTLHNQTAKDKFSGVYLSKDWLDQVDLLKSKTNYNSPLTAPNYTDINWVKGINKNSAAFFIPYSLINDNYLKVGTTITFSKSGNRKIIDIQKNNEWINVYVDGSLLSPTGDGYPNEIKISGIDYTKPKIWSTYTSILEYELNQFTPASDYIIHALGHERRNDYVHTFENTKPDFVRTMSIGWPYEKWLMLENWDFYEKVLLNYHVAGLTASGTLWSKRSDEWKDQPWTGELSNLSGTESITIPLKKITTSKQIVVVEVDYKIKNNFSFVPFFGKIPRYLIDLRGSNPVSLPPYETKFRFPIFIDGVEDPTLTLKTISLIHGAGFNVNNVKFKVLEIPERTEKYLFYGR